MKHRALARIGWLMGYHFDLLYNYEVCIYTILCNMRDFLRVILNADNLNLLRSILNYACGNEGVATDL